MNHLLRTGPSTTAKGGWLYNKNPGNVLVEFEASTVAPSSHDINIRWNGEWIDSIDQRGIAYVAGF